MGRTPGIACAGGYAAGSKQAKAWGERALLEQNPWVNFIPWGSPGVCLVARLKNMKSRYGRAHEVFFTHPRT
jgi:hypothetical protein